MTKQDVIQLLGEPDDVAFMGKNCRILRYSWYEFFINKDDRLYTIQNDNYSPLNSDSYIFSNEKIEIDSWFLNEKKHQDIDVISKLLISKDIKFNVEDHWGREVIKSKSGVIIDFDDDENESGGKVLIGIRFSPDFE